VSAPHAGTWFRAKPPAEVVRDALAMAARKHREGCEPCVDAYLRLARANGASDELIAAALGTEETQAKIVGRALDRGNDDIAG
jgi:AhpD family alkylhydroperoxidase